MTSACTTATRTAIISTHIPATGRTARCAVAWQHLPEGWHSCATTGVVGAVPMLWSPTGLTAEVWASQQCPCCGQQVSPWVAEQMLTGDETDADLTDILARLAAEVDAEVDADMADRVQAIRVKLAADIAQERRWIDAGEPSDLTGADMEPGVWLEAGQLRAWAYDPATGDIITVTEGEQA